MWHHLGKWGLSMVEMGGNCCQNRWSATGLSQGNRDGQNLRDQRERNEDVAVVGSSCSCEKTETTDTVEVASNVLGSQETMNEILKERFLKAVLVVVGSKQTRQGFVERGFVLVKNDDAVKRH